MAQAAPSAEGQAQNQQGRDSQQKCGRQLQPSAAVLLRHAQRERGEGRHRKAHGPMWQTKRLFKDGVNLRERQGQAKQAYAP